MKKVYISPMTIVVALQHQKVLLNGSPVFSVNKDEEAVNPEDTW